MGDEDMASTLVIPYPEHLPDQFQQSKEEFERDARLALAAKLFELKKASSGTAAQLAGVDRVTFLLGLHRFGVPAVDLADDELQSDFLNA